MKRGIYTVHDNQAQAFLAPFFCNTDGEAIRMFKDTVADPESLFQRHAHDFHLYRLGTFDDVTGDLQNTDPPEMLISAVNVLALLRPVEARTEELPLGPGGLPRMPSNGSQEPDTALEKFLDETA